MLKMWKAPNSISNVIVQVLETDGRTVVLCAYAGYLLSRVGDCRWPTLMEGGSLHVMQLATVKC